MRRTFLDYCKDYHIDEDFDEYGKAFVNWIEFSGYISGNYTNHVYVFKGDKLHTTNTLFDEESFYPESLETKTKKLLHVIQNIGYRSEIYVDHKALFEKHQFEFEREFCAYFLETLFPDANFDRELKPTTIEEISLKFKTVVRGNMMKDRVALLENFMEDFKLFISNIPNNKYEEVGFFEITNFNHPYIDIGVLMYSKSELSERVLFYQTGV